MGVDSGGEKYSILSGTRDELGGVDLAIANVYERKSRPDVLSGVLILDGQEKIIAPGDVLEVGTGRYRLADILKHHTGAYVFRFVTLDPKPGEDTYQGPFDVEPIDVEPIGGAALADLLRMQSASILKHLGGEAQIAGWNENSTDTMSVQWNGEEVGPSTTKVFKAGFSGDRGGKTQGMEARVDLSYIRWNPDELYRIEVSGHWRFKEKNAHVFARGEHRDPITQVHLGKTDPEIARLILGAIAEKKN